ncbi:MAG: arginine--tRNA ligase [Eggerthellaceae bacterium]|nr:arginine--tRNA ligase [Eggerthellaceae bacterium]
MRTQLEQVIDAALRAASESGLLQLTEIPAAALERPRDDGHGDWASTVALRCAKQAKKNPREIAQIIIDSLPPNDLIDSAEIAGSGFINIRLKPEVHQSVLAAICTLKDDYGKGEIPSEKRLINLEYVSANPTGPMHVGHGRWAALGDAMARIMRHAGYDVYEEFYVNDAGAQMDLFGASVACRYLQLLEHDIPFIENGYGGGYVKDIAQDILDRDGEKWVLLDEEERVTAFREMAYEEMLQLMKDTLARFGNKFDCWFSERSLYVSDEQGQNPVSRSLLAMEDKGYVYLKDGATWFRSTAFEDEKDRVLIKENGEFTYFMSDVAYHYDKLMRGFDHLINIWGADHHGYVKRCEAMLSAWGYPDTLEIVLGQLVNLYRDGEIVRMSKRTGEMITFAELIEEVGVDSTRYLMLSRSSDQPIDFDIEAAKKKDASNPVYYVQYAHARICSILRKAAPSSAVDAVFAGDMSMDDLAEGLFMDAAAAEDSSASSMPFVDLGCLVEESEIALMKKMEGFGELIIDAARDRAPFRLTHYAQDLAAAFHQFYTTCHVLGEDARLQAARLYLVNATRIVLAKTLDLLGVSAPIQM